VRFATGPKLFVLIAATIEAWVLLRRLPQLFVPHWWTNGFIVVRAMRLYLLVEIDADRT